MVTAIWYSNQELRIVASSGRDRMGREKWREMKEDEGLRILGKLRGRRQEERRKEMEE